MGARRGSGAYARGTNAWGYCERSGIKMLRRLMVYDGQYPDLLVHPDWWEPKHPQEYLPDVTDPTTIYEASPDQDKVAANTLEIRLPLLDWIINERVVSPLGLRGAVNGVIYTWHTVGGANLGITDE